MPDLVGVDRGALVLVNDDDLTYCKARLDPTSLATAIDGIADVAESLPRTLLWSAVWEMTRDALMRARDFVTLAVRGMATEDQIGVLQRVLAQLQVCLAVVACQHMAIGRLIEIAGIVERCRLLLAVRGLVDALVDAWKRRFEARRVLVCSDGIAVFVEDDLAERRGRRAGIAAGSGIRSQTCVGIGCRCLISPLPAQRRMP